MTETAKIITIDGDTALVGCDAASDACHSCAGSPFCNLKERTYEALVNPGINVTSGDRVRVYLPPGKTIISGFMVLILPLLLFLLFYFLSGRLLGLKDEGLRALCGVFGLFLGFGGSFFFARKNRKKHMPLIVGKAND
ncbi:MAG: SoxR reducing system RseC family protein [Spirochaetales bacterium]|nr:SoxR reducing system RseC family protein [Spirochaetales bacterium]